MAKGLAAVMYVASLSLTFITLLFAPASVVYFQAPLMVLLLALAFFAYVVGFARMPRLTWVLLLLSFAVLALNSFYLHLFLMRAPFFISSAVVNLLGLVACVFSLAAEPKGARAKGAGAIARKPGKGRDEGLLIEGIHPKKRNYVAALNGKTYHSPGCVLAKRIKDEVVFVSKGEAEEKKYAPCKKCIP